jgi:hypothetical protein
MFRGYNKPRKSDIFGPSSTGGTLNDARQRQLYQEGEGFGSILSSIFRKIVPFAKKAVKTIAGSSIVKDTGKALKESAITGLTGVAADVIGGDKTLEESLSNQLTGARKKISTAIKASSRKRGNESVKTGVKNKGKKKIKRRKIRSSIFDDDDYD